MKLFGSLVVELSLCIAMSTCVSLRFELTNCRHDYRYNPAETMVKKKVPITRKLVVNKVKRKEYDGILRRNSLCCFYSVYRGLAAQFHVTGGNGFWID